MAQERNSGGGVGFLGLLTILFIALKLTGHVGWSWWIVLSPILGGMALAFAFGVLVALMAVLAQPGRSGGRRR